MFIHAHSEQISSFRIFFILPLENVTDVCKTPILFFVYQPTTKPLKNMYVHLTYEGCSYKENSYCINCGNQIQDPDEYGYCILL